MGTLGRNRRRIRDFYLFLNFAPLHRLIKRDPETAWRVVRAAIITALFAFFAIWLASSCFGVNP